MSQKPPKRRSPTPRKAHPDEGKQVWVACRASHGCEGKQSEIAMRFKLPAGGNAIHYTCLTCRGRFVIRV